jgi:hypothetical protein
VKNDTEIKFRVPADEKANIQLLAEKRGVSMSSLIRQTMMGAVKRAKVA